MAGSSLGLLSLPPEILLEILYYLTPESRLSMATAHPSFDVNLPTPSDTNGPPASNLLSLPPELILEIADHLPADAVLALKLAHPVLNYTLPLESKIQKTKLTNCARIAIRTYLFKPVPNPTHMRCILCKAVYPIAIFSSSSSPACLPLSVPDSSPRPEVVELPPRFCAWHVGRLAKIVHTERGGRNEWVSSIREMCMHCGSIRGWSECHCTCDSCGIRSVRTYTRYLNNSIECRRFMFWRTPITTTEEEPGLERIEGKLYVRETCWDPDATHSSTLINLPVHLEAEPSNNDRSITSRIGQVLSGPDYLESTTHCPQQ